MIHRPFYMETLKKYRDVPLVKILAGIRRCGKSTILEMLQMDLQESGIASNHIISMRFTSEDFSEGMTDKEMYQSIREKMTEEGKYYLLLDEVQEINGWEKRSIACWKIWIQIFMSPAPIQSLCPVKYPPILQGGIFRFRYSHYHLQSILNLKKETDSQQKSF